jgi:Zn-dependent protease with chaperone function
MKKFIFSLLFIFLCPMFAISQGQSLVSKIYCLFLGDTDVPYEYKQMVYQALRDFGLENPSEVSVKQMNGVGPAFARVNLSSFTAFGIWLDVRYLNKCSEEEKIFHVYHEVAHYVLNHHVKILVGCGGVIALLIAGLVKLHGTLGVSSAILKETLIGGVGILAVLAGYRYILPYFVKKQEKQADIMAAKILVSTGREGIVKAHIENLKKYKDSDEDALWWCTNKETIKYLEKL